MSLRVRLVVPAHNEAARIGALLESLARGLQTAARLGADWQTELVVVLDACTDETRQLAEQHGAKLQVCTTRVGKVEALRRGLDIAADVHVCVDADVLVGPRTLFDLVTGLLRDERTLASCPPLAVEPARGLQTPLAWALWRYNAARGFSSERLWLSGRCYAVRRLDFPQVDELRARAARVSKKIPHLAAPLQADDIWLSRKLLAHDASAILHVDTDSVRYRPPSSLRGMSRTHRRLRRELARIDLLFPELPGPGRDRRIDQLHGVRDRLALGVFRAALQLCRWHARLEDVLLQLGWLELDPWPVVSESKA